MGDLSSHWLDGYSIGGCGEVAYHDLIVPYTCTPQCSIELVHLENKRLLKTSEQCPYIHPTYSPCDLFFCG